MRMKRARVRAGMREGRRGGSCGMLPEGCTRCGGLNMVRY